MESLVLVTLILLIPHHSSRNTKIDTCTVEGGTQSLDSIREHR